MKKIIIKARVRKSKEFVERLDDAGLELEKSYWQHDRVYVPRGYQKQSNYPRLVLRTEVHETDAPARYVLVMKRHIEDSGMDIVDQTAVEDYAEAAQIIQQLGFTTKAEVSRRRRAIEVSDEVVIYVDEVDGVGNFVKIETKLLDEMKIGPVREDLARTLRTLGGGEEDVVRDIYADM